MKSVIRCIVAVCAILFISEHVYSQSKKTDLKGAVKDSAQQKALSFATVNLFKRGQLSEPFKVTYTNESGQFQFKNIDTGLYKLEVSYTGFTSLQLNINTAATEPLMNILLQPAPGGLKNVTVTAKKPLIEQTDDKIIFNAENDPASKTGSALDILRKAPFVSVDGNENITVNGQSSFKVLLNGRETSMFSQNVSQALKGFPGATIVKVEVITNPSAKYDAEGVGGIINIITKKKVTGYNGMLSGYYNTIRNYNGNLNFNMKKGKVGISINYSAFGQGGIFGMDAKRNFNASETYALNSPAFHSRILGGSTVSNSFANFGNAEFSLAVDSLSTLSIYGSIYGGHGTQDFSQSISLILPTITDSINSYYTSFTKSRYPNRSIGTDYVRKFKGNTEKEFSIRFYSEFNDNKVYVDSYQDNPGTDRYIANSNYTNNKQFTLQSDFIQPLKKSKKLETGVKIILRKANSDYQSLARSTPSEAYKTDPLNTNEFNYDQQVYSAYGSFSFKIKQWSFRTGLRVEHTEIGADFVSSATVVSQSYTSCIPNLQVSKRVSKVYNIVLSYNQRIQRPFINSLNPFINNNDSLNISYGNPRLKPQLIHSVAFQNRFNKGKVFAGLTLTGSYSNNKVIQISSFNSNTGVTTTYNENLGKEFQLSLNGNGTIKVNTNWNLFINLNLRYNQIQNTMDIRQKNSGVSGIFNISNSYKFGKNLTIALSCFYLRNSVTIQGYSTPTFLYDIGGSQKLFKEKLTASFSIQNLFQDYRTFKQYKRDNNFTTTTTTKFPARNISLGLTWNFGKLKENVSKKRGVNNDDVL